MPPADYPGDSRTCFEATVTGYIRTDPAMNPRTFDGTPITTPEPITAASSDIPLQAIVEVEGLGEFRVADRGSGLRWRHVDIAVWSKAEALALTSTRLVCWRQGP